MISDLKKKFIKNWLSFLFPPLCYLCKEPCTTQLFCSLCWEECALPDPALRCRHCFEEMEEEVCPLCKFKPQIPIPSAFVFEPTPPALYLCASLPKEDPASLAAFAFVQWERLDWPIPDAVIPLAGALKIARIFASWVERPCSVVLRSGNENWECEKELIEENGLLLLFSIANSREEVEGAAAALADAFPKKIFVLSLTPLRSSCF